MTKKTSHSVEVAVNSVGDVLIAYSDPALDAVEALRYDAATRGLRARVRNGLADAYEASLGVVSPEAAGRLASVREAIFSRGDEGKIHGGLIAVEQVN